MLEILSDSDGLISHLPRDVSNDNINDSIIFHDGHLDTCPCEEMLYVNDSVLMQADVINTIEDSILDVNFSKSEHNIDHLYHFSSVSLNKQSESEYLLGRDDERKNANDPEIEETVIVEEIAEEEVYSESLNQILATNELLKLDKNIKMSKMEKFVFSSFDNFTDEFRDFDIALDSAVPRTYSCSTCGMSFRRKNALFNHIRSHTDSFENDISLYDNTEDSGISDTIDDPADQFSLGKTRKTPFCWLSSSDEYLENTIKTEEQFEANDNIESKCSCYEEILLEIPNDDIQTNKKTSTENSKTKSKRSRTRSIRPLWLCHICDKPFYTRARLKRHLLTHRDKTVICDECGEKMADYRALANHRSSHQVFVSRNGVLTTRTFPCYACNKVFGSRSSQQIHLRIHTGERPYSCRYCVKAFADGGTLRKHERIHTGEKPYVCPICRKAFNQRVVLREHIRAHHAGSNSNEKGSFTCEVCSEVCSSSCDLCSHLVKHSDENTAKHRTPLEKPRKYKSRKK